MSEEWYILGGIICILLVFLMIRKCKKAKDGKEETGRITGTAVARTPPPPLPKRISPNLPPHQPNLRALDYPKCPIDRSRNEPGKPQVIFWDGAHSCYTCCHGHQFTGRE